MPKTLFILGAGASAEAGAPVMRDFIDKAEELYVTRRITAADDREAFEAVFDGIHRLQSVFAKSSLDTNNLESVFVAFEMAELLGRLGDLSDKDRLKRLPDQLRRVIVRTLEQTILYSAHGSKIRPHASYVAFARAVQKTEAAVITFNYDLAMEYAMACDGIAPNYHVDGAGSGGGCADVLKLHGSLNWYKEGDDVKVERVTPRAAPMVEDHTPPFPLKATGLAPDAVTKGEPIIVPPTQNKGDYHRKLRPVWTKAAEILQAAEEIHVIGFSLPTTDEFFRYLFALGTVGRTRVKRFAVYDPYPTPGLYKRYESLLGEAMRPRFVMYRATFGEVSAVLAGTLVTRWEKYTPTE